MKEKMFLRLFYFALCSSNSGIYEQSRNEFNLSDFCFRSFATSIVECTANVHGELSTERELHQNLRNVYSLACRSPGIAQYRLLHTVPGRGLVKPADTYQYPNL